jgi:hypothetical protein
MELSLSQVQNEAASISVLNVGAPKTGKDYSLATLAQWLRDKGRPPIIHHYDFDPGAEPLARRMSELGFKDENLRVFRFSMDKANRIGLGSARDRSNNWLDFVRQFNLYYDQLDTRTNQWKEGYAGAPGAIVLSTLTAMQEQILDAVLQLEGHELGAKGTDARSDFGKQMGKLVEVIESAKSLPAVLVCNAHEQIEKDDLVGNIMALPAVTGKLAPVIAGRFSVVIGSFYNKGSKEYKWVVKPQGFYNTAGSRHVDFTMNEIDQDYRKLLG